MLLFRQFYFLPLLSVLFFYLSHILLSDETLFVKPDTSANISAKSLTSASAAAAAAAAVTTSGGNVGNSQIQIGTADPVLGNRIAKISNQLREIPKDAEQIWREYDITPYTKGRKFLDSLQHEQTIVDWILRQTGTKIWHSAPFGILTADSDKLYVYNTKNVQLVVADIVDRFIHPVLANESYSIRVISLSRPNWLVRGRQYLQPIRILSPGVQGWVLDKEGRNLLLQELAKRNDFNEITSQHLIPNGIAHHISAKQQRRYLRDIQPNPSAVNGYAEDWVTIDEGFDVTFVPLAAMDGWRTDAIIKLDITQIDKMIPLQIDAPTTINPKQRIEIESPQVAKFNLDEQIRWPKEKVLLLDLGTIPLPNLKQTTESNNVLAGLAKNLSNTSKKANILLAIEKVNNVQITTPATVNQIPAVSGNNMYWNSRK
ncbi:MAG: hypothetical protein LBE18_01630 [Planctomycetaceae bacterium]|jgi:hypothetical protein|nr:hypothetical protein [Planctomycetaceae bacterium]